MDTRYVIDRLKEAESILANIRQDSNIFFEIGRAMGVLQCTAIHIDVYSKEPVWVASKD